MRFARYHRIVVDVYAMQHPERYGRSAKSFAAHLTKPPLPPSYGVVTIRELVDAEDPVSNGDVLHLWARSTWDAYVSLHATARFWIAASLLRGSR